MSKARKSQLAQPRAPEKNESHVSELHDWMDDELAKFGARIDAFEYCPYHAKAIVERYRQASPRTKPAPGMITDLLERYPVDVSGSLLIGDKSSDLEAAAAAGVRGFLFPGGNLETFIRELLSTERSSTR
ncbi:HAD hydrolase-like protein [Bradyrhizobium sp. S3.5.5]|uniref:HAD hydrolase-like protein n=1 Tax=unclassified Bradyrhizobium TaxID=2631580 RepID=UPI00339351BC